MDPYSQPNAKQPSRWPLSKRATIIAIVALVVIVGIVVGVMLANRGSAPQNNGDNSSLYYDRPGYDRSKLSQGISDPFAITFSTNDKTVNYQGQAVIQACNVLTAETLQNEDLLIKANTLPTPIARTFNDGVGKAAYGQVTGSSLSEFSLGDDVNSCRYLLEAEGTASVGLNVFQPFAVPPNIVNQEIQRDYTATSPVEGLEVYKNTGGISVPGSTPHSDYILRKGTSSFYISIALPSAQAAKEQAILTAVAKNFNAQLTEPTGVSTVEYNSPPLTKPYVRACDLLTNDDVHEISGKDASPLVREGIASSTALLRFSNTSDATRYVNVQNECTRNVSPPSGLTLGGDISVKVATTSYLSDTPAKHWLEGQRQANPNNRERMNVAGDIGDEAVAYTDAAGGGHLLFRKGRIVVDISLDNSSKQSLSTRSLNAVSTKLAPVAQTMAERVKQ